MENWLIAIFCVLVLILFELWGINKKHKKPMEQENKYQQAMSFADKYEEGYMAGVYDTKRKHWKPSEEHLSALLAILNDPNNIGSQTCQLALSDLYEQLKKL